MKDQKYFSIVPPPRPIRAGKGFHFSLLLLLLLFPGSAKNEFKTAMKLLEKHQFGEAKTALQVFIARHPKSPLNPEALYTLGRLLRDPERAYSTYREVFSRFPQSDVADDALFKIGQYHFALGNFSKAKKTFKTLLLKYPKSNRLDKAQELVNSLRGLEDEVPMTNPQSPKSTQERSSDAYTVQVGSFENVLDAHRLRERLIQKGYSVIITHAFIEGKTFHRVRVGTFSSREKAFQFGEVLKEKEDLPAWVVKTD